jgi:hypothetical protein
LIEYRQNNIFAKQQTKRHDPILEDEARVISIERREYPKFEMRDPVQEKEHHLRIRGVLR